MLVVHKMEQRFSNFRSKLSFELNNRINVHVISKYAVNFVFIKADLLAFPYSSFRTLNLEKNLQLLNSVNL